MIDVKFNGTVNGWLNSKCKIPVDEKDFSFIAGSNSILLFLSTFLDYPFYEVNTPLDIMSAEKFTAGFTTGSAEGSATVS